MSGDENAAWLGSSVASAGDVNQDGYADLLIGAYFHDAGAGANADRGRAYVYLEGGSTFYPIIHFVNKSSSACSGLSQIDATWNGHSSVAALTNNLLLQVYRFGSTNAWETVTTNSSLAADTDGNITGSRTTSLSEYCDGSNWSYWRLYQNTGTQTLRSDYWTMTFTAGGGGGSTDDTFFFMTD
jgi:hypothetical protein